MSSPNPDFSHWWRRSSLVHHDDDSEPQNKSGQASSHPNPTPLPSSPGSGCRDPIRSFIPGSVRDQLAPLDTVLHARNVRDDSADLATYLLSKQHDHVLSRQRSLSFTSLPSPDAADLKVSSGGTVTEPGQNHAEVTEAGPFRPASRPSRPAATGQSMLTAMIKQRPPHSQPASPPEVNTLESRLLDSSATEVTSSSDSEHSRKGDCNFSHRIVNDETPLLSAMDDNRGGVETVFDCENQTPKKLKRSWKTFAYQSIGRTSDRAFTNVTVALNPKSWSRETTWQTCVVEPIACLPAAIVGLLLNVLDALSYGMILFPLGDPLFSHLGSAGISIFYVSTIISQLTFSTGSVFRGAIGSELIEVVPFFHSMAKTIADNIGRDKPDAVIATTMTSYAVSSMLTGMVFFLMGKFKLGSLVGFIPRHILIGCIGGMGWFLVVTGFEVTARLGSFKYDWDTAQKLGQTGTLPLWLIPLALSLILFYSHSRVKSKYFLPLFILTIPLIFYACVFAVHKVEPASLRERGWIFEGPPPGEPWWYFYTLYKLKLVRWDAVGECAPAMLALTFFSILHVPINVPALALHTGEDHANLDRELKLHGYSNFLSGLCGSIQNYLVYANTVMIIRSGADSRLAGYLVAALTFLVMMVGPDIVGFIPIMMVGTLIFDLGLELLLEAIWIPRKKLKPMEYMTVFAIVLIMGIYDFVIGIGIGILLAFATLVFQASRISAIRNTFTGDVVGSTVRRNPIQHHYLKEVGRQVYIMKLSGYLFFGTIVSVEEKIRSLIADESFKCRPIEFLVLDLWNVTGIDYSAGEAFNTISRLLKRKKIVLTISGVDADSVLGRNLRTLGIGEDEDQVLILATLNSALESCENEMLKTFYVNHEAAKAALPPSSLAVPTSETRFNPLSMPDNSPRTMERTVAAKTAIEEHETVRRASKWQHFTEPLRLMLQIFHEASGKNEDFWFKAVEFFVRRDYGQGSVLFRAGIPADGFWLLEKGVLRAEYDLPQGFLCEIIVAGTTCGELPFFSDSIRTATVIAERECFTWMLTRENWERMQAQEPEIARELLQVGLKLTSERMEVITGYTLAMAG